MGGLVVKQMLYQAKAENKEQLVNNTVGVVCFLFSNIDDESYIPMALTLRFCTEFLQFPLLTYLS